MRFGPEVPNGFMPVFSVDTEEDARHLLVLACGRNLQGEFFSRELTQEQSFKNLRVFSDRLAKAWEGIEQRRRLREST